MVERLFLAVPRVFLQFVIVVFPDHTHLLFFTLVSPAHLTFVYHRIFVWHLNICVPCVLCLAPFTVMPVDPWFCSFKTSVPYSDFFAQVRLINIALFF